MNIEIKEIFRNANFTLYIYIYLNVSPELWVHTQNLIDKTYTGTNVQI